MDLAYDHIEEDIYYKDSQASTSGTEQQSSLNNDLQDAYKAISSSPWGQRIGGFLGNVVKQGESVYNQAQKELAEVGEDASRGFTDLRESLITRTRGLSLNTSLEPTTAREGDDTSSTPTRSSAPTSEDVAQQHETVLSRLRHEAAKRLKDLQKAEDAADEALLRFGGNVRDFLRDAITIAPPNGAAPDSGVLFESKDAHGKRVIHTSRFDAQLHVIHTSADRLSEDPSGPEFEKWASSFDVDEKTKDIGSDLADYPELRDTMEKLVPNIVPYADFWKRYYFLRHGIETAESKRRDLLHAAAEEDEVDWGDESDEEGGRGRETGTLHTASVASSTTLHPKVQTSPKAAESRKSHDEKSQADSEASYDVVGAASGKTSQAPSSPKDAKRDDESDEDWE